jgi:hypothetical protein
MVYSNEEKAEMLLMYGECEKIWSAQELYMVRYSEKIEPSQQMFSRLIKNLSEK